MSIALGIRIPLLRGQAKPLDRFLVVLRHHALAFGVQGPQFALSLRMSLFGGLLKLAGRLMKILGYLFFSSVIISPKIVGEFCREYFLGKVTPSCGFLKILRHAFAYVVHNSQVVLGERVTLLRQGPHYFEGGVEVYTIDGIPPCPRGRLAGGYQQTMCLTNIQIGTTSGGRSVREAKVLIEGWRQQYNHIRPHSSLGYKPPAPEARTAVVAIPQCA